MVMAKNVKIGEVTYKRSEVTYKDSYEYYLDRFTVYPEHGYTFTDIEDEEVDDCGISYALNDFYRMSEFIGMAMAEIEKGGLTPRLRNEIELDMPVWDTGKLFQLLNKEDQKLIKKHIEKIKEYLKANQ